MGNLKKNEKVSWRGRSLCSLKWLGSLRTRIHQHPTCLAWLVGEPSINQTIPPSYGEFGCAPKVRTERKNANISLDTQRLKGYKISTDSYLAIESNVTSHSLVTLLPLPWTTKLPSNFFQRSNSPTQSTTQSTSIQQSQAFSRFRKNWGFPKSWGYPIAGWFLSWRIPI